jgi:hypothetical protein
MKSIFLLPFALQGVVMIIDEFYYHRKRGLPQWEKIGHPLDTLSVLACYGFLLALPPNSQSLNWYIGLCAFSCLFVTKDEFIHAKVCTSGEIWLHSLLFILHPITLYLGGFLWMNEENPLFIQIQFAILAVFLVYQTFFWSFYGRDK